MHTYHRTIDGQQVADSVALDERGTLRPGHTMRTKLTLMDGLPGGLTDEQRCAQIDRYKAQVSNAWRNPVPEIRDEALPIDSASIRDPYARYDRRVQDAWRS